MNIPILARFEVMYSGVAEDSSLLGCYTVLLGKWFMTFLRVIVLSFSQSVKTGTVYPTIQRSVPEDTNPHGVSRERKAVVLRDS